MTGHVDAAAWPVCVGASVVRYVSLTVLGYAGSLPTIS